MTLNGEEQALGENLSFLRVPLAEVNAGIAFVATFVKKSSACNIYLSIVCDEDASGSVLRETAEDPVAMPASYELGAKETDLTLRFAPGAGSYTFEEGDVLILDEDVPLGFFAQAEGSFGDVKETDWFFEAVSFVSENGIMNGIGNGEFDPDSKLDRSMMAQILWNLAGNPTAGSSRFGDVQSGDWFAGAVAWAAESGIVNGVGGNLFAPGADITREQMAVMLYNYCKLMNIALPSVREGGSFTDAGALSDWAAEAVQAMYKAGILSGKGGGVFDPQGTATRAEVAQMLMNFMKAIEG